MNLRMRLILVALACTATPAFADDTGPAPAEPYEPPSVIKFEVPLDQLSTIPILASYEQNTPEQNTSTYVRPVCQALGYEDTIESSTSFQQPGVIPEVVVYDAGSATPRTTAPEYPGMVGILTRLVCARVAGS